MNTIEIIDKILSECTVRRMGSRFVIEHNFSGAHLYASIDTKSNGFEDIRFKVHGDYKTLSVSDQEKITKFLWRFASNYKPTQRFLAGADFYLYADNIEEAEQILRAVIGEMNDRFDNNPVKTKLEPAPIPFEGIPAIPSHLSN